MKRVDHENKSLLMQRTGVRELVSVAGSLRVGKRYFVGNETAPKIMARMLTLGTKMRNKRILNETLEDAAIALSFNIDNDRLSFATVVPNGKEALFCELLSDILQNATFPDEEFALVQARYKAELLEESTDPESVAWRALSRQIFPKSSVQYLLPTSEEIKLVERLTVSEVREAHARLVGACDFFLAVAGDVDEETWSREFKNRFNKLGAREHKFVPAREVNKIRIGESIFMADKTSVNAYWGLAINLDINSPEYYALRVLLRVLGGDFISRLMSEVREKRGLTYGTRSNLAGIAAGDTGLIYVSAMFAPSLLDKGVEAVEEVLAKFISGGITKEELERAKKAIVGEYLVRLASSGGMSRELLSILELNRPTTYIEEFPVYINAVTEKSAKEALAYLKSEKFVRVLAGTLPEKKK